MFLRTKPTLFPGYLKIDTNFKPSLKKKVLSNSTPTSESFFKILLNSIVRKASGRNCTRQTFKHFYLNYKRQSRGEGTTYITMVQDRNPE